MVAKKGPPFPCMWAMNGKNQLVVRDELVEFKKEQLEVQDFQVTNFN